MLLRNDFYKELTAFSSLVNEAFIEEPSLRRYRQIPIRYTEHKDKGRDKKNIYEKRDQ